MNFIVWSISTGMKWKSLCKRGMSTSQIALYLRRNEFITVGVVITVIRPSLNIFWKVPASWSACVCVRMMPLISPGGIPSLCMSAPLFGGGSTMMPRPPLHRMKPVVVPEASKPWDVPRKVTPSCGMSKTFCSDCVEGICTCDGMVTMSGIRVISRPSWLMLYSSSCMIMRTWFPSSPIVATPLSSKCMKLISVSIFMSSPGLNGFMRK